MRTISLRKVQLIALVIAAIVFGGVLTGVAYAVQGHMVAARSNLNRAYSQLNMAIPDKAGHRVQAMQLVQQAINQVNAGIAAGAR